MNTFLFNAAHTAFWLVVSASCRRYVFDAFRNYNAYVFISNSKICLFRTASYCRTYYTTGIALAHDGDSAALNFV